MTDPGILIAFEGIDASGLTTHSRLIVDKLSRTSITSVYTKEPTQGPIGMLIRSMLSSNHENHDLLALLFAADRVWHYRLDPSLPGGGIRGALKRGISVVTDRYKYSSMAYQGSYIGIENVDAMNLCAPEADIIVFIDLPPSVALRRLSGRSSLELYETESRLKKIKKTFEDVLMIAEARGVRVIRVNAAPAGRELGIEELSARIWQELSRELSNLLLSRERLSLRPLDSRCPL